MSKLTRVTAKVFGATADGTLADPEIGQFGSAKAGTYVGTSDVATIQNLSAWSNGWIDAVTPTQQFPTLPERTGVDKVLSYQNAYVLQQGIPEWDSATDYYTNGFCSKNGKIYFSKTDNNVNHDPETDTVNWEEFTSGGGSRNIGEIIQSTIPLTDAGLHLLDGALIDGNGIYSDFVDYIASIYDASANYFTTEASWQDSVTNYGVCGKFVYNSTNRTVRLPKITGFVEGASGVTNLGDLTQAGLPDHTHSYSTVNNGYRALGGDLFYYNGTGTFQTGTASASNPIYGRSNTVQPQSIKVLYYIVIATSTKTDIEVDIDEIATDLNGKADVDLSNVPTSKGILTENYVNGTSWYRVYSDGWCEQGGKTSSQAHSGITINLLQSYTNTNYTITISNQSLSTFAYITNISDIAINSFKVTSNYGGTNAGGIVAWQTTGYIR